MDLEPNEDQHALIESASRIAAAHADGPRDGHVSTRVFSAYAHELDEQLTELGFFEISGDDGPGPLSAALVTEVLRQVPAAVEYTSSTLVAPALGLASLPRPFAIGTREGLGRPIRFLSQARTLIVHLGDEAGVVDLAPGMVESVEAPFAYPMGRLATLPDEATIRKLGSGTGARLRVLWMAAAAVEAAAAMLQAVEFTTGYVTHRRQFGRPLGAFQAIQHRLAVDAQLSEGSIWLARRAAWSGLPEDAATAALHALEAIPSICFDCHQFNGALGMTLEHHLHFWTFRLRALQGELQALGPAQMLTDLAWGR